MIYHHAVKSNPLVSTAPLPLILGMEEQARKDLPSLSRWKRSSIQVTGICDVLRIRGGIFKTVGLPFSSPTIQLTAYYAVVCRINPCPLGFLFSHWSIGRGTSKMKLKITSCIANDSPRLGMR